MNDAADSAPSRARGLLGSAAIVQSHAVELGLVPRDSEDRQDTEATVPVSQFDTVVRNKKISGAARKLYDDRHYARAVEEAFKCLNNLVKERSGLSNVDGDALMRSALSANNPVLKINDGATQSQRDEQAGYMDIFAGSIKGIRNPRAHDHRLEDAPATALELLSLASHLADKAEASRRARKPKVKGKP